MWRCYMKVTSAKSCKVVAWCEETGSRLLTWRALPGHRGHQQLGLWLLAPLLAWRKGMVGHPLSHHQDRGRTPTPRAGCRTPTTQEWKQRAGSRSWNNRRTLTKNRRYLRHGWNTKTHLEPPPGTVEQLSIGISSSVPPWGWRAGQHQLKHFHPEGFFCCTWHFSL